MPISKQELDELRVKLAELKLSDNQRLLLDKVMKIAWDHAAIQRQLDAEFDDSFEPEEAAAIMAHPRDSIRDSIRDSVRDSIRDSIRDQPCKPQDPA